MKSECVGTTRKPPTFKLAKVTVNAKLVLQAVDDLEPLCVWMNDSSHDHSGLVTCCFQLMLKELETTNLA